MTITLTDQIQFSNITVPFKNMGGVIGKSNYKNTSGQPIDDEYSGEIQKPSSLVNAIDIDWNDANIADAITILNGTDGQITEGTPIENINTTGDLLYTIANLQAQVTVLTNLVKGLYMALDTSSNS